MQRDFNVLQESFNVRYVTNLDILLQCVIKKANSHQILLKQENPRHNNFKWGPYTPTMILIKVDLIQILKIPFAYR